jgi:hypothetical protein
MRELSPSVVPAKIRHVKTGGQDHHINYHIHGINSFNGLNHKLSLF